MSSALSFSPAPGFAFPFAAPFFFDLGADKFMDALCFVGGLEGLSWLARRSPRFAGG